MCDDNSVNMLMFGCDADEGTYPPSQKSYDPQGNRLSFDLNLNLPGAPYTSGRVLHGVRVEMAKKHTHTKKKKTNF